MLNVQSSSAHVYLSFPARSEAPCRAQTHAPQPRMVTSYAAGSHFGRLARMCTCCKPDVPQSSTAKLFHFPRQQQHRSVNPPEGTVATGQPRRTREVASQISSPAGQGEEEFLTARVWDTFLLLPEPCRGAGIGTQPPPVSDVDIAARVRTGCASVSTCGDHKSSNFCSKRSAVPAGQVLGAEPSAQSDKWPNPLVTASPNHGQGRQAQRHQIPALCSHRSRTGSRSH